MSIVWRKKRIKSVKNLMVVLIWRLGRLRSYGISAFLMLENQVRPEIDAALKLVDYKKVKLNDQKQTIYLEEKGMALDLGAIAKGFIADEVVKLLKKHGVTTAIVDLGGNVYVLGKSPRGKDTPWTVGIQDPNQARNVTVGSVLASNQTLVTSGIYERYLEVDGVKYHHLFNPKTGYPFDN